MAQHPLCISVSGYKHASAVELGLGVGSFVSMGSTSLLPETSDVAAAAILAAGFVLLLLPIQVHPPGGNRASRRPSAAWLGRASGGFSAGYPRNRRSAARC